MVITKLGFFFWGGGVVSIHFRAIRSIYRTGIFFFLGGGVAKISNIFWGVNSRCSVQALVSSPPPGSGILEKYEEDKFWVQRLL